MTEPLFCVPGQEGQGTVTLELWNELRTLIDFYSSRQRPFGWKPHFLAHAAQLFPQRHGYHPENCDDVPATAIRELLTLLQSL